jgi:biopolymer transport protein ExbB
MFDQTFDHAIRIFKSGGPVMWPILLCSLLGLTIVCERLFAFTKYNFANYFFRNKQRQIIALTREGKYAEALELAKVSESPICSIFAQALQDRDAGFTETLEAKSQQMIDRLRSGFSILDTVITVAPMLGILGTVTGIINTFHVLSAAGIENPTGATSGIAEALITTAAGLIVSIGCLFPFNFFIAQLNQRTHELGQLTHQMEIAYNTSLQKKGVPPVVTP